MIALSGWLKFFFFFFFFFGKFESFICSYFVVLWILLCDLMPSSVFRVWTGINKFDLNVVCSKEIINISKMSTLWRNHTNITFLASATLFYPFMSLKSLFVCLLLTFVSFFAVAWIKFRWLYIQLFFSVFCFPSPATVSAVLFLFLVLLVSWLHSFCCWSCLMLFCYPGIFILLLPSVILTVLAFACLVFGLSLFVLFLLLYLLWAGSLLCRSSPDLAVMGSTYPVFRWTSTVKNFMLLSWI